MRLKSLSSDEFLDELNIAMQQTPEYKGDSEGEGEGMGEEKGQGKGKGKGSVFHRIRKEFKSLTEAAIAGLALNSAPRMLPPLVQTIESKTVSFPLAMKSAKTYYSSSPLPTILMGDAAHTIHPQAGQGLNLGLADAELLSDLLVAHIRTGGYIADSSVLRKYSSTRYRQNISMQLGVDAINSFFGGSHGLV